MKTLTPGIFRHFNCRNNVYPQTDVKRFQVPDQFIFWTTPFSVYEPANYTSERIRGQPWADKDISELKPKWHTVDGNVNRVSYNGKYTIDMKCNIPLNPFGRTGIIGRGLLGRWGPNHAADPVVTRWKRNENGAIVKNEQSGRNILEMVAIQRHDNKLWAIPGGMVDPGENVSATLRREFMEEALDSSKDQHMIESFFLNAGTEVYKGYVDDYRNTDNAWMETVAYNFHDEDGTKVGKLKLSAGDDAMNVKWLALNGKLELHANHIDILKEVAERLNAHW